PSLSTLSLHDALPICAPRAIKSSGEFRPGPAVAVLLGDTVCLAAASTGRASARYSRSASCADLPSGTTRSLSPLPRTSMYPAKRSEEHTSELQSRENL